MSAWRIPTTASAAWVLGLAVACAGPAPSADAPAPPASSVPAATSAPPSGAAPHPAPGGPGGQGPSHPLLSFSPEGRVAEVAILAWADGDAGGLTRARAGLESATAAFPAVTWNKLLLAWTGRLAGDPAREAAALATIPPDRRPIYTRFFARDTAAVLPYLRYHVWQTCGELRAGPCGDEPSRPEAWPVFDQVAWVSHSEDRLSTWTGGGPADLGVFFTTIGVKPGLRVADVGAGEGWFTFPLARAVGPGGAVIATEIDPAYTDFVAYAAGELGLPNVTAVVQTPTDIRVPPGSVDLVFLCEVFKAVTDNTHAADPAHVEAAVAPFLASIHRALVPGGRFVVIDHDAPEAAGKDISASTVRRLVEAAGFRLVTRSDAWRPVQVIQEFERL